MQDEGRGSVALLFATEEDVQNAAAWEKWLLGAPPKRYTIYVHAQDPKKVTTPLFKDSLVNEGTFVSTVPPGGEPAVGGTGAGMHGALTSTPCGLMPDHAGNGTAGKLMHSIMALLKEALKEPSNKWFMVLDGSCLPMVCFDTFLTRISVDRTKSVFDFHPNTVQRKMLSILETVTEVPPLVREAIENKDLVAHSPVGTMLVRRDARVLAQAPSAVLREWQGAFSSGPLQHALFSPHGARYFGNWMQGGATAQPPVPLVDKVSDMIDGFFSNGAVLPLPGVDEPAGACKQQQLSSGESTVARAAGSLGQQSVQRSLCLSVDEVFLFALLRRLSRLKQGETCAHEKVARVHAGARLDMHRRLRCPVYLLTHSCAHAPAAAQVRILAMLPRHGQLRVLALAAPPPSQLRLAPQRLCVRVHQPRLHVRPQVRPLVWSQGSGPRGVTHACRTQALHAQVHVRMHTENERGRQGVAYA
jgi:hypothetical protein